MKRVSFYFSAGDFFEALKRFDDGLPQFYQTHNEVAGLIHELAELKISCTIFSFVTPKRQERDYSNLVKIVDIGAKEFRPNILLERSLHEFPVDAIIAQYPTSQVLRAALSTKSRIFPILAATDNQTSLRAWLRRRRYAKLLNHSRFALVSNHCFPATEQLAQFGVRRDKLVPWDIEHPFHPSERPPKPLRSQGPYEIFYVGSISEAKGVGDLVRALPLALRNGIEVRCVLAGGGAIEPMRALARSHGIEDKVVFAGMIPNPEVLNRMSRADIVVVPSRPEFPEGFPLSMFEAIASRTAIVCSDHPVFRNVLRDQQNAMVFRAGDPISLAGALQRAIRDPELCHRLSRSAERTWDSLSGAANWRTLIRTWLLEGPGAPWIRQRVLSRQS